MTAVITEPREHQESAAPMPTQRNHKLKAIYRRAGTFYSAIYVLRFLVDRVGSFMDRRLVAIEQRKGIVEPWTISARRFTVADNQAIWNTYDWSQRGEEWTPDANWKDRVVNEFLVPNVPEGGAVLEIGPGGGRWTAILQRRVAHLRVVDISERAIALCRERFAGCDNITYLIGDGITLNVPDEALDAVWSYDVFVHINPLNARNYFREFRRILKPGARAVIHHPGEPKRGGDLRRGWRSDLTDTMVRAFAEENGLRVVWQTSELVNPGDHLTVFEKPT